MTDWPTDIPNRFNRSGYQEAFANNSIVTQMDVGPPKRRRRSTTAVKTLSGSIVMTTAQVALLEDFFYDTVKEVERFNFTHPRTGDACVCVFASPPSASYWAPGIYNVSISLQVQP